MPETTDFQRMVPRCLAALRRRRGVTQSELGERMGVGRRRVAHIEGRGNPTLRTVDRYLKALDYRSEDLLKALRYEMDLDVETGREESALTAAEVEQIEREARQLKERLLAARPGLLGNES